VMALCVPTDKYGRRYDRRTPQCRLMLLQCWIEQVGAEGVSGIPARAISAMVYCDKANEVTGDNRTPGWHDGRWLDAASQIHTL